MSSLVHACTEETGHVYLLHTRRLLASLLLNLDNLSERLHHATYTYLPYSLARYVKTEGYALPLWLLEGAALCGAVSLGRSKGAGSGSVSIRWALALGISISTTAIGYMASSQWALAMMVQLPVSAAVLGLAFVDVVVSVSRRRGELGVGAD